MANVPKWKQAIIEMRAKKAIGKLYKDSMPELQEIKNKIGDLIESKPDEVQMQVLVVICSEMICGFEEKKDRDFILKMIESTLSNLD